MSRGANWPRLSETLTSPRALDVCQSCGRRGGHVQRWEEHDANDQPEAIVVVLCEPCGERLIEKHPRLYRGLHVNEPMPGSMALCAGCTHQRALACDHPDLRKNGGPGLALELTPPSVAFVDGIKNGRRTGWREKWWPAPAHSCVGRETP